MNAIKTVIAQLQLALAILEEERENDDRLEPLLTQAQTDLARAASEVIGQDSDVGDT